MSRGARNHFGLWSFITKLRRKLGRKLGKILIKDGYLDVNSLRERSFGRGPLAFAKGTRFRLRRVSKTWLHQILYKYNTKNLQLCVIMTMICRSCKVRKISTVSYSFFENNSFWIKNDPCWELFIDSISHYSMASNRAVWLVPAQMSSPRLIYIFMSTGGDFFPSTRMLQLPRVSGALLISSTIEELNVIENAALRRGHSAAFTRGHVRV